MSYEGLEKSYKSKSFKTISLSLKVWDYLKWKLTY